MPGNGRRDFLYIISEHIGWRIVLHGCSFHVHGAIVSIKQQHWISQNCTASMMSHLQATSAVSQDNTRLIV
jgi:hypothetical protein